MSAPALKLEGVTKCFESVVAVDNLSFGVPEGTIFGFLGPNGAGKTTTMRMILDILRPDKGRITCRGRPITDQVRRCFGYLPEERGLYAKMRVGEQLVFFARLYGMKRREAAAAVGRWLERFDLGGRTQSRLEELSKGNQQKVQVIASLVHQPDIVLLDEPFAGLDPINTEHLREALLELKNAGKTVLFSSHRLEQVEDLCEEIAIIAQGWLRLAGNLDEIRRRRARRVLQLRGESGRALDFTGLPVRLLEDCRDYQRLALAEGADPRDVLDELIRRDRIEYFALERPSLQEIFLEATAEGSEVA